MLFNSVAFFLFFSIVFLFCFLIQLIKKIPDNKKNRIRNIILLVASYYFYAFLKWEFLILLAITTITNYITGYYIAKNENQPQKRSLYLWMAVIISIGILGYFKYTNFFIDSINKSLSIIGIQPKLSLLKIILPVGISFFTFQALSYTLDVFYRKIHARRNLIDVALFVSFFPTIMSGPIEKARNLLPQFESGTHISLDIVIEGGKRFLWGLFKKIVIADRLAEFVNMTYSSDWTNLPSLTILLAVIFYSIQIYADFSGYSDMAIGIAHALGFHLKENFYFPYFSTSIKSFWKRWHISLTSWFSEYLYIPLGGNRVSRPRWILNISIVFLVSGLWHGANWAFIVWGALHAIYYLGEYYLNKLKIKPVSVWLNRGLKIISCLIVFVLVTIAWVFFRLEDFTASLSALSCIVNYSPGFYPGSSTFSFLLTTMLLLIFFIMEWIRFKEYKLPLFVDAVYFAVILSMLLLFGISSGGFVYFQF